MIGPWRVMPEAEAQSRWIIGDSEGYSVADCEPSGPWVTTQEADANAQLIACAPELLEALKYVLTAHGEQLHDAFDQAQKVIAKATRGSSV